MVILSTLWFALRVATFSLFRPLIWFRTTFLLLVTCNNRTIPQTIKYRKLQSINMEAFKGDIKNFDLIRYPKTNATELAQQYDSSLYSLINVYAPLVTKRISIKPPNPCMTPAILASKQHRRYLERVWRSNPTALNRSTLTRQTHLCNRQMSTEKLAHYSKIIDEHSGDYGSLWKAVNIILYHCPKMHLPDRSSIANLANTFRSFSLTKVPVICSSFASDPHSRVFNPPDTREVLQSLSCVTFDEVCYLVLRAPCKSSDSDPIPTSLVKDCIDISITPITSIINLLLTKGSFPSHFKSAHVSPFWKYPPSIRIAWRIAGQCLILASFARLLRK